MLELFYKFFKKFCDTEKYEELKMDTDSLQLALFEDLLDVILPGKRAELDQLRSRDCTDSLSPNATADFFSRTCCNAHKKHGKENWDYIKKSLDVQKCCACVAKPIIATIERIAITNSVAKDSMKVLWKTVEMDPCQSIAKLLKRQSTLLQTISNDSAYCSYV